MLDKKVKIDPGTGYSVIPEDKYIVQAIDVNAVEQANQFKGGAVETRLNYQFVILDEKKETDDLKPLRGRYLWKRTSLSLNEKSWLYKLATAVKGSSLTPEEKEAFDPESIVGKQVTVMTANVESSGRIFTNILSFSPVKTPLTPWQEYPTDRKAEIEKSSQPAEDAFIEGLEKDKAAMMAETVSEEDVDEIFGKTDKKKK